MDDSLTVLKKVFGFEQFQGLQKPVIDQILLGRDALVLMPTGGGKSICYQVPALLLDGLTVVISPLLALMKDQVDGLHGNGVMAAYLNSSQSPEQSAAVWTQIRSGKLKLLYTSPERLFSGAISWLPKQAISLLAVDEAHCISSWGHDFRPEYTQIGQLRRLLPGVPCVALTATADPAIQRDILDQLAIAKSQVFQASFDRPNLSLTVRPGQKRLEQILAFLESRKDQSGIIYCLSRSGSTELAKRLNKNNYQAQAYHAGLSHQERSVVQDAFLHDNIRIVCATIAFGMGVDKSNIRWVLHYNLPKNIESFYQEIGRAGRDGLPADTVLFYSYADVAQQLRFLDSSLPERRALLAAKLDRMKQYAEATICRRRILLTYFGQIVTDDCGYCDVCLNPPARFDATVLVQKLLSVVARTGQLATLHQVILILRGSQSQDLIDRRWHEIKTYGIGKNLKFEEWMDIGSQLINSGWCDLAYDDGQRLKLNEQSWLVLKNEASVALVAYQTVQNLIDNRRPIGQAVLADREPQDLANRQTDPQLLEVLRLVRKRLADQYKKPAYLIFSDKTLREMAIRQPTTDTEFLAVNGVGEAKLAAYGQIFLEAIRQLVKPVADRQ